MATGSLNMFEVANDDVRIRFSCLSASDRISRAMKNMRIGEDDSRLQAEFSSTQADVRFRFDGEEQSGSVTREAVFFENTSYPTLIEAQPGVSNLKLWFSNSPHERERQHTVFLLDVADDALHVRAVVHLVAQHLGHEPQCLMPFVLVIRQTDVRLAYLVAETDCAVQQIAVRTQTAFIRRVGEP